MVIYRHDERAEQDTQIARPYPPTYELGRVLGWRIVLIERVVAKLIKPCPDSRGFFFRNLQCVRIMDQSAKTGDPHYEDE